jgi:predicted XRE-type DNA-binding protein
MKNDARIRVKESSGNIFRDLGFPHPEREHLKARLTLQIYRLVNDRGLTQTMAGQILGIRQLHVSGLMRGQSGNFSVERLRDFLTALGQDVEITRQADPQGAWRGVSGCRITLRQPITSPARS